MDNIASSTSLKTNFITTQHSENFSHNIKPNKNSSISTLISKKFVENNISNKLLPSELNIFSEKNNEKIIEESNSSILMNTNKIQRESLRSSIPYIPSESNIFEKQSINNYIKNFTVSKTVINSINFNYNDYNNTYFNNKAYTNLFNINITQELNNSFADNSSNEINNSYSSNNILHENKSSFLPKNLSVPFINKSYDTNFVLGLGISVPIIIILIVILICYFLKKKKSKMSQASNFDLNRINFKNPGLKLPYNKLQNTSNINAGINANNISMSEIKVQNLKDEIHNIITNSSGGSNSSGKRKRDKKKSSKNNNKIPGYPTQQGNKGIQNEMKEQIKQYVIDEHINN